MIMVARDAIINRNISISELKLKTLLLRIKKPIKDVSMIM